MIYHAVIDTNILVSALLSSHADSATVRVVEKLFSGEVIPVFSAEILKEYYDVLRRAKFHFSESTVDTLLLVVEKYGQKIIPSPTGIILPDKKDLPFYEAAVHIQKNPVYLVTGNGKHFPTEPFIVTAHEFLKILETGM